MKLSDAMMLGSVTCKMERGNWNSCSLGAAGNAVGIPNWGNLGRNRHKLIEAMWPWIRNRCTCGGDLGRNYSGHDFMAHIFCTFDDKVVRGQMTLEQLVDWVRTVEPKPLALPAPAEIFVTALEQTAVAL